VREGTAGAVRAGGAKEKLTWLLKSSLISSVKRSQRDGLAVGEVVTLKSGGPLMTVQQLDLNEDFEEIVICKWFDEQHQACTETFAPAALVKAAN